MMVVPVPRLPLVPHQAMNDQGQCPRLSVPPTVGTLTAHNGADLAVSPPVVAAVGCSCQAMSLFVGVRLLALRLSLFVIALRGGVLLPGHAWLF